MNNDTTDEQDRISQLYADNKAAFQAAQQSANKGEWQTFEKTPVTNDTPADAMLTSGRDILAENFDQIRLAFDSLKRDRDRLKNVIISLRVNAIKGDEPEALIAFMRDGLGGVDAGLTIGEMICAYEPANPRTTSLAAQDGLVERVAEALLFAFIAGRGSITARERSAYKPEPDMSHFRAIALASIEVKSS